MDEQKIRQLIRQEVASQTSQNRFRQSPNNRHVHNDLDSPKISGDNVLPRTRTLGRVTIAQQGVTYKFITNSQPETLMFCGTPYHKTLGVIDRHTMVWGQAALGQNLPFQPVPNSTTSVISGGKKEIIQGSTCFMALGSGVTTSFAATQDENHIINVNDGSSDVVRATVTGYDSTTVYVYVDTLSPVDAAGTGWTIIGNFYVT